MPHVRAGNAPAEFRFGQLMISAGKSVLGAEPADNADKMLPRGAFVAFEVQAFRKAEPGKILDGEAAQMRPKGSEAPLRSVNGRSPGVSRKTASNVETEASKLVAAPLIAAAADGDWQAPGVQRRSQCCRVRSFQLARAWLANFQILPTLRGRSLRLQFNPAIGRRTHSAPSGRLSSPYEWSPRHASTAGEP